MRNETVLALTLSKLVFAIFCTIALGIRISHSFVPAREMAVTLVFVFGLLLFYVGLQIVVSLCTKGVEATASEIGIHSNK
jgi:hypothetical protein